MTLGGIAAAIGLLIDDVIVMIEHIARRAGVPGIEQPHATVLHAAREFFSPLIRLEPRHHHHFPAAGVPFRRHRRLFQVPRR